VEASMRTYHLLKKNRPGFFPFLKNIAKILQDANTMHYQEKPTGLVDKEEKKICVLAPHTSKLLPLSIYERYVFCGSYLIN